MFRGSGIMFHILFGGLGVSRFVLREYTDAEGSGIYNLEVKVQPPGFCVSCFGYLVSGIVFHVSGTRVHVWGWMVGVSRLAFRGSGVRRCVGLGRRGDAVCICCAHSDRV